MDSVKQLTVGAEGFTLVQPAEACRALREVLGDTVYERAVARAEGGGVFSARSTGSGLQACCEGSAGEVYRVRAELRAQGHLGQAFCSCPAGAEGRCKHVGALVLRWLLRPEEFARGESTREALQRVPKEVLEQILAESLERDSHTERRLKELAGATWLRDTQPAQEGFLQRAAKAYRDAGTHAEGSEEVAAVLRTLVEEARRQPAPRARLRGLQELLQAWLLRYPRMDDRAGELSLVAQELLHALAETYGACAGDATLSMDWVRGLYRAYARAVELGLKATRSHLAETCAELAVSEHRQWLSTMVQQRQTERWLEHAWAPLALVLRTTEDDVTELQQAARHCGMTRWFVARCLQRPAWRSNAVQCARQLRTDEVLGIALYLRRRGQQEETRWLLTQLVAARRGEAWSYPLVECLRAIALEGDAGQEARHWELELFALRPEADAWLRLRDQAVPEKWSEELAHLEAALAHSMDPMRVVLALERGDLNEARARLLGAKVRGVRWSFARLGVARALAPVEPAQALALYREQVEVWVGTRNRVHYREALELLLATRQWATQMALESVHQALCQWFESQAELLPALKQELAEQGLRLSLAS